MRHEATGRTWRQAKSSTSRRCLKSRLQIVPAAGRVAIEGTAGGCSPHFLAPDLRRTAVGKPARAVRGAGSGKVPSGASVGMPLGRPTQRPGRKARGSGLALRAGHGLRGLTMEPLGAGPARHHACGGIRAVACCAWEGAVAASRIRVCWALPQAYQTSFANVSHRSANGRREVPFRVFEREGGALRQGEILTELDQWGLGATGQGSPVAEGSLGLGGDGKVRFGDIRLPHQKGETEGSAGAGVSIAGRSSGQ